MKLDGPKAGCRVILGSPDATPCFRMVIVGVFPPEDAAPIRVILHEIVMRKDSMMRAYLRGVMRVHEDLLLYGNATIPSPRGILNLRQR